MKNTTISFCAMLIIAPLFAFAGCGGDVESKDRAGKPRVAIAQGGRNRLRPVLMTAFTTIFGMLPLALSNGEGSEMWNTMGTTVIGGFLVSTFITLIFVPILYAIFEERIKNK